MFAPAISKSVHPATWAILGMKKIDKDKRLAHRGTGFAVDSSGHILTCWHVTFWDKDCKTDCDELYVMQPEFDPDKRLKVKLVHRDKAKDLALLKIEDDGEKTHSVRLVKDTVPFGRSCAAFGHPLSMVGGNSMRIFTRAAGGMVSMPYTNPCWDDTEPVKLYELDFFTHSGVSGGPVILRGGEVFGVARASVVLNHKDPTKATRSNLSIAISSIEVVEFLHGLDIQPKLVGHVGTSVVPKKPKRHSKTSKTKKSRPRRGK